ncbi:MAG TPA: hypothetical protein PK794_06870 [Armatimonadota bacterium]|nr:hypothetical protein [Armatimonadota bacterium]
MRMVGWVLGGLYALDGLVALVGGRRATRWADRAVGSKLPRRVRRVLHMGDLLTRTWGANNLLAGLGLLAVAALLPRRT